MADARQCDGEPHGPAFRDHAYRLLGAYARRHHRAARIALPDLSLRHADGSPNDALVAAYSALHDRTVNIADAYAEEGFDFSGTRAFDQRTGYRSSRF